MESIKKIIQDVLIQTDMNEKIEECKALLLWDSIASSLAARTEPVAFADGKMVVNVTDSVILHQLTFLKKEYIDKINLILGKRAVKDIIFHVGKVEKRKRLSNSKDDYIKRFHSVQLDESELTRIDEIVAEIEDQEIQDSLRELFISQSKFAKLKSTGL